MTDCSDKTLYPKIINVVKARLAADICAGKYYHISMRTALRELGCNDAQIKGILEYCSDNGFNRCLDYTIPHSTPDVADDGKCPPPFACEWGVDQLLSRLWGLGFGSLV